MRCGTSLRSTASRRSRFATSSANSAMTAGPWKLKPRSLRDRKTAENRHGWVPSVPESRDEQATTDNSKGPFVDDWFKDSTDRRSEHPLPYRRTEAIKRSWAG